MAKKEKKFKIKRCPKCKSDEVRVVLGEESKGEWQCNKCGWSGKDIEEIEISEEELLNLYEESKE